MNQVDQIMDTQSMADFNRQHSFHNRLLGANDDDMRGSFVSTSSFGGKKDPNVEFFQMLLLSYKMNNQDLEEVMELDYREMYKRCTMDQKINFFQFNEWIAKEFEKIRYRKFYHQNKKRLERNKRLLNKLEAMDGVKLVQDVQIVEEHYV